jgi:RNA polymerase sigma factor (sigma-70 family)
VKATQSLIKQPATVASVLPAALHAARISPSDEIQLASRLADCRRELLALALFTPEVGRELASVRLELASGVLAPADVADKEETKDGVRPTFEQWSKEVAQLQQEAIEIWPALDSDDVAPESDAAKEAALRLELLFPRAAELVGSLSLDKDLVSRLLASAGALGNFRDESNPFGVDRLPSRTRRRARRLVAESDRIRSRFVRSNQGLVTYVSQRYIGMGLSQADLIQEGNIGLMRAIDKFDHRRGSRFGTYAIWWIRQGIRRALANQARTIRVPVHALGTRYTLEQATRRLTLQRGRAPSEQELAEATGILPNSISQVMNLVREPLSLDAPRAGDTELSLGDSLTDPGATNAVEEAVTKQRSEQVHELIASLSPREQAMIKLRFGLDGSDECTLEQIGQRYALTRERVRQIVSAALQKLQRQSQQQGRELSLRND